MWVVLAAIIGAGLLCIAYAALVERHWFALRRHRLSRLPAGASPFRILHVSDLHFRSNLGRMRRFIASLHDLQPDLVIGTGDFLGDTTSAKDCAAMLAAIPSRLGGVFVLGSNDYYAPIPKNPVRYFLPRSSYVHGASNSWEVLTDALEELGWQFLCNRSINIEGLEVTGLDDPHINRHDLSVATPRTPGDERFRIAVVHSPEIAEELAQRGYDLVVAGHTHGGQLRVPLFGALITNAKGLPRRMARGLHRIRGSTWLHVSAGMGTSKYAPVRFSCRPEACLLELEPVDMSGPSVPLVMLGKSAARRARGRRRGGRRFRRRRY